MITGPARIVGDNIDTDAIIPARHLSMSTREQLGPHCLEGLVPPLSEPLVPGSVLIAGHNFGCGSSREHAVLALLGAGLQAVVARSFARIFFRNAVNTGLVVVKCPDWEGIIDNAIITLDLEQGQVLADSGRFAAEPMPPFVQELIAVGGLVPYVRHRRGGTTR